MTLKTLKLKAWHGSMAHLLTVLFLGLAFVQPASAEVSDRVFEALVGEQVKVELDGNVIVAGLLKNVEGSSVIVIHEDGEVMEISKSDVANIRAITNVGDEGTQRDGDIVVVQQQQQQQEQQQQSVEQQSEQQQQMAALVRYEQRKMDPWGPFALNFLLGFGIGSFVQGDTTTGLLLVAGDLVGIGLVVAGAGAAVNARAPGEDANSAGALLIVGYGVLTLSRIAGLVVPFTYANAFNEKLRRELGIYDVSLIVPGVGEHAENGYGIQVSFAMDP